MKFHVISFIIQSELGLKNKLVQTDTCMWTDRKQCIETNPKALKGNIPKKFPTKSVRKHFR